MSSPEPQFVVPPRRPRPFRSALFRGLGALLPPLLTIVILVWIWQTVKAYLLEPVTSETRDLIAWRLAEIRDDLPGGLPTDQSDVFQADGKLYRLLDDGHYVPLDVYMIALRGAGSSPPPTTGIDVYRRYVEARYMRPIVVIPVFTV